VTVLCGLPLVAGGAEEAGDRKPHVYRFERLESPDLPDRPVRIAEGAGGKLYFAARGKEGVLLEWDGREFSTIVRGDVGDVAVGAGGMCYYTLEADLWVYGWPERAQRTLLPAFAGKAGSGRRLFCGRSGELWVEGAQEFQTLAGRLKPGPRWEGPAPAPLALDQHGNLWALARHDADDNLSCPVISPAHGGDEWRLSEPKARIQLGAWHSLVADDLGFVWSASEEEVRRLDPRKTDAGWVSFPPDKLPAGKVTALGLSPSGRAVAGLAEGALAELDVLADGTATARLLNAEPLPGALRAVHTAGDGSIWVVTGGRVYRADPAPDAWQRHWESLAPMPWGNHDVFGAVLDGKLYVAGGMAAHGYPATYTFFDELFVYDAERKEWSVAGTMETPRCYCGVAALDGKVWVVGGYFGPNDDRKAIDCVEVFDPKTGKWSVGPALDRPRAEAVVVTVADRLYVIGGAEKNVEHKSVVSIVAGEKQWRPERDAPEPVRQANGCALGGKIYVITGGRGEFCYDPARRKWSKLPAIPGGKTPRACLCAAHNGEVWVMGGYGTDEPRATWRYSPKDGKWRRGPDLPTPLGWGAAGELGGKLILAGGAYRSEPHKYYIFTDRTLMLRE